MAEIIKALYNCSFTVWNSLITIAMTLFKTSPKAAAYGTPYAVAHGLYNAISDATVPIATVFFIIAIYKSVISAPPGQQAMRFLQDAFRYCIILFIAANMWSVMGYIIDFSDGITSKITATSGYTLTVSGDMESIIDSCLQFPTFELSAEWLEKFWSTVGYSLMFLIGGIVMLFIMVASCLSILSSAFQRILKPLMILPFAGIAIALGAGGHEISRSLVTYIKTFFGFCISGAVMVIAIKCGSSLCTNLVNFNPAGYSNIYKCILITVQMAITPIVISGLVKGSDAMIARMF